VKVPAGFYSTHRIPSHNVAKPLGNLQIAVWANPRFIIISIGTDAGLSCVFNPTLDFGSSNPHTQERKI
jgi:hypothetical protein